MGSSYTSQTIRGWVSNSRGFADAQFVCRVGDGKCRQLLIVSDTGTHECELWELWPGDGKARLALNCTNE